MLYSSRLWPLVRAEWRGVLGVAALMVAGTVCGVTVAVLAGSALAAAVDGEVRRGDVVLGGVLLVVRALLLVAQEVVAGSLTTRVTRDLRRRMVDHVLAVGPDVRTGWQAGTLSGTLVEGVAATAGYVAVYAPTLVATLLGTLLVGGLLLTLAPWSAGLLLVGILAVPVLQRLWKRATAERGAAYWQATGAYAARLEDTLHGLETLAALGTADRRVAVLRADADEIARTATAGLRSAMFVYVLTTGSLGVATAGATVALAADAGAVGVTAALVAWLVLPEGARPWQALQNAWHHGFSGITASGTLFKVLDRPVPVSDSGGEGTIGAAPEVWFEDVVAVRGGRRVLDGVTCTVAGGRTTALVGRSGSGKSTALGLLMRHRDADVGRVLVDGVDVRDLPLAVVRGAVAWVAQDVTLLHGTVADNLRLAAPAATDFEIEAAASRARLLLSPTEGGLAHGLETQVGERGAALSGGQRQRVAIARALLRDAPILVLDEATSALDAVNERAVAQALAEAARGRTVIVVAHDRSSLPPVDDVLVLSGGRVTTGAADSDPVLT